MHAAAARDSAQRPRLPPRWADMGSSPGQGHTSRLWRPSRQAAPSSALSVDPSPPTRPASGASSHATCPFWSTSRSAQIKMVTVVDLVVLLQCERQPRADDPAELYRETGRWRPGPAAHTFWLNYSYCSAIQRTCDRALVGPPGHGRLGNPAVGSGWFGGAVPGRLVTAGDGLERYRLLDCRGVAVEAAGRRRHRPGTSRPLPGARRLLALPRSPAVAMGVLVAKDGNA